ncbi:MAG: ATP-dependent DNA ligase [Candidatus Micrarchaeia archaeon]
MLFSEVSKYYQKLEDVSSRLSMIDILSELFSKASKSEIRYLIYFTQGVLAPSFEGKEIGLAEKSAISSISLSTGLSEEVIEKEFNKTGDLGITVENMISKSKQKNFNPSQFTLTEVFETMEKISMSSGQGSKDVKIRLLSGLISNSSSLEAKYIIRFALGTLRLGLGDATILESLSKAVTGERTSKSDLENAYNLCSDLGKVGFVLYEKGIEKIKNMEISLFNPIRPELAERAKSFTEIMERMNGTCAVDGKYDGLRIQLHMDKKIKRVELFSRNLEKMTLMFPEIVKYALTEIDANSIILDGEAIAYDEVTEEFRPFQETIQRKRKHGVKEKSSEMPLHLFAFDIMYLNGTSLIDRQYSSRRESLEKVLKKREGILPSIRSIANSPKDLELFFNKQITLGLEGIVAKDLNANYVAGARKFTWIKMKRSYRSELSDTLDLVIIGYYLGKGSRAEFGFGGLLVAAYNDKKDVFESVTKIGTGFTENHMAFFKKLLDKIKTKKKPARVESEIEPDFWVDPIYVIEVIADEITRSPMHSCGKEKYSNDEVGYALRFPRIVSNGIREDKKAEDATTTHEIIEMFSKQKKSPLKEN